MRLPWTSIGMQQRSSLQLCPNPRTVVTLLFLLTACACEREERRFSEVAPMSSRPQRSMKTELRPGAPEAPASTAKPVAVPAPDDGPYAENAWAVAEGKRLYTWFNCVGCHSPGAERPLPARHPKRPDCLRCHARQTVKQSVVNGSWSMVSMGSHWSKVRGRKVNGEVESQQLLSGS